MEILTARLSADRVSLPRQLPRLHCHANERDAFPFFVCSTILFRLREWSEL